ncbi:unnamed protein product [Nippostrongylus brasiliensis]|uniref:Transmembrane protein n=1 Tax=Nippostrongylus brasiliensis TaxID=27835 RepID=A0A0N4Y213_NIPBR|nr:unnamed protein product [Nippostrongylus brasiliensis]
MLVIRAKDLIKLAFVLFQRSIEKAARLQRKRLRGQNREKQRRERKSRHNQLKKTIRDAKALQKAAAAAGRVAVVDKELKRQWKAAQEAASLRREEKARKRAEHETRKEARRAKRDKKRGRKRRDPSKSKKAKDASNSSSAAASAAAASTGSTVTASIAVANSTASAIVGTDLWPQWTTFLLVLSVIVAALGRYFAPESPSNFEEGGRCTVPTEETME